MAEELIKSGLLKESKLDKSIERIVQEIEENFKGIHVEVLIFGDNGYLIHLPEKYFREIKFCKFILYLNEKYLKNENANNFCIVSCEHNSELTKIYPN